MKQLLALTEGADFVCYRYRIDAFRDALAARGWQLDVLPRPRTIGGFLGQLSRVAAADAVVLQRRLLSWWKRRLLRRAAKVLFYDFDDAIYLRDSNHRKPARDARRWRSFRQTVHAADACFAGNMHLREQAARCASTSGLHVVPTCVDHRLYPIAVHRRTDNDVQMVWVGSHSTLESLHNAHAGLAEASSRLPGMTLKVVCDVFHELKGVQVVPSVWASATEGHEIADADIGIAWLPDHPWSLGKCGLKVLQYMAAGLPVVANPVGIHRELIVDGETGFLPATPRQWGEAIETLARSNALRRQMGRAGRARLIQLYSVEGWGPRFAAMVDALAGGPPLLAGGEQ
jgi:glycosyltransferase involved in cell wall biosynthesis